MKNIRDLVHVLFGLASIVFLCMHDIEVAFMLLAAGNLVTDIPGVYTAYKNKKLQKRK